MEYNGFLYDTSQGIALSSSAVLEKPNKSTKDFVRRPFIGIFKVCNYTVLGFFVSMHLHTYTVSLYASNNEEGGV